MTITARPVAGRPGMAEILIDGESVQGIRCLEGSARISDGQIEFTAKVTARPEHRNPAGKKEKENEDHGNAEKDMDT